MKTNTPKALWLAALLVTGQALAQTNLNFNNISTTIEGAVRLSWNSTSNEFYEIDYADSLVDTNTGSITWNPLYSDYPSHGTNTFIADAGNYDLVPEIVHPKYSPARFYRIALAGTNTSATKPYVAILSLTNNTPLSGSVTVAVSSGSSELLTRTTLYLDGEEMWDSEDGTNFVINTCEWPNGKHVLFAVAKSQSGLRGLPEDKSITYGRAVSPYVTVIFTNLITRYDFSQPFFEPELGQTQMVSAVFAANVDWTIQVQDASSNTVRSTNGSGTSMTWAFDGLGFGGTNLPAGPYSYLLTVQTNGQSSSSSSPMSESLTLLSTLHSENITSDNWYPTSARQAVAAGLSSYFVEFPPFPYKSNGVWVVPDVWPLVEVQVPESLASQYAQDLITALANEESSDDSTTQGYGGPSSQSARGPTRKPKVAHISKTGTFGMAWDRFPNGLNCNPPRTGFPISPFYVKIDGQPTGTRFDAPATPEDDFLASMFCNNMKKSGYKMSFGKNETHWAISDITGSGSIFNAVNLGILSTHGSYGETTESDSVLHTYLWYHDGTYARLGNLRLGSAGANGLRWMTLYVCSALRPANITSMANHSILGNIISEDLHLLLGSENVLTVTPRSGWMYATNLTAGQTIPDAWFNSLKGSLAIAATNVPGSVTGVVTARVLGWNPCFSDTLHSYSDPDTSQGIRSLSTQMYP